MPAARARLVAIPESATLVEVAKRLRVPETSRVAVCAMDGAMCRVIGKTISRAWAPWP
jgi:hypothetical protein